MLSRAVDVCLHNAEVPEPFKPKLAINVEIDFPRRLSLSLLEQLAFSFVLLVKRLVAGKVGPRVERDPVAALEPPLTFLDLRGLIIAALEDPVEHGTTVRVDVLDRVRGREQLPSIAQVDSEV